MGFLGTNQTWGHFTFSIIIKLLIKLNMGIVAFPYIYVRVCVCASQKKSIFILISYECNVIYIYI